MTRRARADAALFVRARSASRRDPARAVGTGTATARLPRLIRKSCKAGCNGTWSNLPALGGCGLDNKTTYYAFL
jgi:hypothetical protein